VKLLFDQNLSSRLVRELAVEYPGSVHVRAVGLDGADDARIWEHAKMNELTIVTKDDDFRQRSFVHGAPPKVVWLQMGNCSTDDVASVLRANAANLDAFHLNETAALLVLSRTAGAA
jgi:predicted nuclease of predicted toxin-antitoxin system